MRKNKKRPKVECEVCGCKDTKILHRHHVIERTELISDNSDWNLAILCPNCHSLVHAQVIKIIGVFPSTNSSSGKILVYIKDGVSNVPDMENEKPYYTPKPLSMKVFNKEDNS